MSRPSGALAQRIADVLAIPYNDASVKHSLHVLETNFDDINSSTLLDAVEQGIQLQVGRILGDMEPFYHGIKDIEAQVDQFQANITKISHLVEQVQTQFSSVTREAEHLEAEDRAAKTKIDTLTAFMGSFTISDGDLDSLKSQAAPIDAGFYSTFEMLKQIQQECTVLMADSPRLAEDLLTRSQQALGHAYEKLQQDVRRRADEINESGSASKELQHHLRLLSQEPFMFKEVLTELCELRKRAVKRDFVRTNTASSPTFDPERLVGEDCAWLHSVVINEYDLFRTLIGTSDKEDFSFALFSSENSEDVVYEIVNEILQAVEPLFKQRIHRLISTQSKILVLDSMHNVIGFYGRIFKEHKQHSMAAAFDEISQTLSGQFKHLLLIEIEYAKQLTKVPANLEAPDFIHSVLGLVRRLFANYQNSLNYQPLGDEYIRARINDILDPFIDQSYALGASLDTYSKHIFSINCLDPIKLELTGHSFANFKIDDVNARIGAHQDNLVSLETDLLVKESGLKDLEGASLYAQIDRFVVETLFITGNRLAKISSPSTIAAITKRAYEQLITKYEAAVPADAPKSVDDLRILLS